MKNVKDNGKIMTWYDTNINDSCYVAYAKGPLNGDYIASAETREEAVNKLKKELSEEWDSFRKNPKPFYEAEKEWEAICQGSFA